jgi:hypothetical protein
MREKLQQKQIIATLLATQWQQSQFNSLVIEAIEPHVSELVTGRVAARLMGVALRDVKRLLTPVKLRSRRIRYRMYDVIAYLAARNN